MWSWISSLSASTGSFCSGFGPCFQGLGSHSLYPVPTWYWTAGHFWEAQTGWGSQSWSPSPNRSLGCYGCVFGQLTKGDVWNISVVVSSLLGACQGWESTCGYNVSEGGELLLHPAWSSAALMRWGCSPGCSGVCCPSPGASRLSSWTKSRRKHRPYHWDTMRKGLLFELWLGEFVWCFKHCCSHTVYIISLFLSLHLIIVTNVSLNRIVRYPSLVDKHLCLNS